MIARLFGKRDSRPFLSPGREVRLRAPAKMLLDGETKENLEHSRSRLILAGSFFMAIFATISYRLVDVAVVNGVEEPTRGRTAQTEELRLGRADITDRNGVLLATNLPTVNLFADGRDVRDPEESARALARVLPGLDYAETLQRLSSGQAFVYLKRNLTPKQQFDVNTLGLPGVQFQKGEARVYPQGHILSHTVGMTNVDNQGLSGIELAFDQRLRDNGEPMALSIDLRLQHLVTRELATAIEEFDAVGAAGVVLDARTGEVLALSSLPDFDPHSPPAADDPVLFNRVTKGLYEMGSVFKLFTAAAALETGTADLTTRYDATDPIQVASFTIKDFHPLARPLTVAEIITHSSNIGAAKMGLELGGDAQREFLSKLGILDRASIEVPEISTPRTPSPWRPINTMTISYGHGISVTPLHVVSGVAALVNGGFLRPATLLKSTDGKFVEGRRVLSFDTSRKMRHLMRLVVEEGSGRGRKDRLGGEDRRFRPLCAERDHRLLRRGVSHERAALHRPDRAR